MDDEHEELADGQRVVRDQETGQFTHSELTPERAAQIGSLARPGKEVRRDAAALADALVEAATGGPEAREKARSLLLRALAPVIQKGGGGSVQAVAAAAAAIGETFAQARPPQPGERCKLCGRTDEPHVRVVLSAEAADPLAVILCSKSDDERVRGLGTALEAVTRERNALRHQLDRLLAVRGNGKGLLADPS